MEKLFEEARAKGLWFYTPYQQLWFSPDELATRRANGRYRWDESNWKLRDPKERLEQIRKEAGMLQKEAERFAARLSA